MIYRIRRVKMNDAGEIVNERKRCETYVTDKELCADGLYFLRKGKLYRVEVDLNGKQTSGKK